jgi:hypothetical protein
MKKLVPIETVIKYAPESKEIFHIFVKKEGKEKLVCYGRVFPINGTKKFVREFEKEYGTKVVNRIEFFREVKADVKAHKQGK